MKNIFLGSLLSLIFIVVALWLFYLYGKDIWQPYLKTAYEKQFPANPQNSTQTFNKVQKNAISSDKNIKQRVNHLLATINDFVYYPSKLTLIALKDEKKLEVWGFKNGNWHHIHNYDFTAFSGHLGPKIKEGDRQIPEGIYAIEYLNPNSSYHLSMKLNYPNAFDKKMAQEEKRGNLGSDIMIHGKDKSIGCIPIGDSNIEELYLLVEQVGIKNVQVIVSPMDFRSRKIELNKNTQHQWIETLYQNISSSLKPFKI